jgi:hypothetical protein
MGECEIPAASAARTDKRSAGRGKNDARIAFGLSLGWPLITKDHIKETLFDAMGGIGDSLEESRRFGAGAMETLWALAGRCPQVVLEANFRPRSDHERARLSGLNGRVVEVNCACPVSEAIGRFKARGGAGVHPAHPWHLMDDDAFDEFDRPMGLGEVITVDTTRPTDIDWVVNEIVRRFGAMAVG